MSKFRTDKEIEKEIKWLEENKPNIRRFNGFGENNHEKVDAEIDVLKNRRTEMQIYSIYESFDSIHEDDAEAESHAELDAALDAYRWMSGEDNMPPSEDWENAVIKK